MDADTFERFAEVQSALDELSKENEILRQRVETLETAMHAVDGSLSEQRTTLTNVEQSILDKMQSIEADLAQLSDKGGNDDAKTTWVENVLNKYFTADKPAA